MASEPLSDGKGEPSQSPSKMTVLHFPLSDFVPRSIRVTSVSISTRHRGHTKLIPVAFREDAGRYVLTLDLDTMLDSTTAQPEPRTLEATTPAST